MQFTSARLLCTGWDTIRRMVGVEFYRIRPMEQIDANNKTITSQSQHKLGTTSTGLASYSLDATESNAAVNMSHHLILQVMSQVIPVAFMNKSRN